LLIASAGASSAHLTVSETCQVEICAETISVFYTLAPVFGAVWVDPVRRATSPASKLRGRSSAGA